MLANLLEEEEWLRRVARGITDDQHLAEDIVQSAYLAAMRSPPRDPAKRRAWLRTVVKNFARLSYRESSRRTARERATAREEAIPSAERWVEENELHGLVAETVAKLAEPYRSTIIEHYYHGRTSNEIASELGIPANTVRVRIRRAVMQLSSTLDRRCDGRRAIWVLPLLGFFLAPERLEALAAEAAAQGAGTGSSTAGSNTTGSDASVASSGANPSNLMKAFLPVATLALIVAWMIPNTFGVASPSSKDSNDLRRAGELGSSLSPTDSHSTHTSFGPRFDSVPVDSSSRISPPSATSSFAMIPRLVHVVDRSTGKPISDAEVFVESFSMVSDRLARGRSRLEYLMQDFARQPVGRTDARGTLEVDPARLARDRICVRAPGYSEFRERERLRTSDDAGALVIDLAPAEPSVVAVQLPEGSPARRVPLRLVAASGATTTGETDTTGHFEFLWEEGQYAIEIDLPGFREVRALALPDTTITLARAPLHTFAVTNARGLPVRDAMVEVRLADRTLLRFETSPRGNFSFHAGSEESTEPESATVRISHPDHPLRTFEITLDPTVRRAPSLALDDPSWVEGIALAPAAAGSVDEESVDEGNPRATVGGGIVLAIPTSPFYVRDLPRAAIDREGRFRLGPLPAGGAFSLRIEGVDNEGRPFAPIEIAASDARLRDTRPFETRKVEVTLERGRTLRGRIVTPGGDPLPGVRLRLGAVVGDELRGPLVESDRDGRFAFDGVSPTAQTFRPTLREPRWSALGSMDPPPETGRILQVLTPHQLLAAGGAEIPRKFFLGSRNTLSVPDFALADSAGPLELVVAPWPRERMPRVVLRDADGNPVRDVLNWVIHPPEDPADVSAIFAGTDGNPVRIGDPTPLEGCWIQFVSERHAVTGGWFGLRSSDAISNVDGAESWEVTLLPRVSYDLRFRAPLEESTDGERIRPRDRRSRQIGTEEGVPLANTDLWWVPAETSSGAPPAPLAIALGRTDAKGELEVDQLPPGRYRLLLKKRPEETLTKESRTEDLARKSATKAARPPRPFKDAIAIDDGTPIGFLVIPATPTRRDRDRNAGTRTIEVHVDLDGARAR